MASNTSPLRLAQINVPAFFASAMRAHCSSAPGGLYPSSSELSADKA